MLNLGAIASKAQAAYDRNITGKGVTVAVIDSGIAVTGPEFAGRISADSKSFDSKVARCDTCPAETVSFPLDDIVGHGTKVASVILAAKDGRGMAGHRL